jgi:hypothetical protein
VCPLAEVKRWAPWVAKKIVDRAVLRYDEPRRADEREAAHANIDYCKPPLSQLAYALYTYVKAPFRAREHRPTRGAHRPFSAPSFGGAMAPQSVVLVLSIAGLAGVGGGEIALIAGLTVSALGLGLGARYGRRRTAARATAARERRDRSVRLQVVVIGVSSTILFGVYRGEALPFWVAPNIVDALTVCLAAGAATVYASSLVGDRNGEFFEIDFGVWLQQDLDHGPPRLVFGEAKTFNAFEQDDFRRAERILCEFPEATMVFATMRPDLEPPEHAALVKLATKGKGCRITGGSWC